MKKHRIRIPKGLRLALAFALLLALLFGCLCYQNWPRFRFEAAYRRVVEENLRPETPLALRLEADEEGLAWAIGLTGDGTAYEVLLERPELTWRTAAFLIPRADAQTWDASATLLEFPETEGLCCVPLYWRSLLDGRLSMKPRPETPALALKAEPEAVRAEATLTVETYTPWPDYHPDYCFPAGSLELTPLGQQEGWFLFGFGLEAETLAAAGDLDDLTPTRSLVLWPTRWAAAHANNGVRYTPPAQASSLEIRLYDEHDDLLRTVTIAP